MWIKQRFEFGSMHDKSEILEMEGGEPPNQQAKVMLLPICQARKE